MLEGSNRSNVDQDVKRRIRKSSAWAFVARFGSIFAMLGLTALLSRKLTEQEYGDYSLVFSGVLLVTTFALLGLPTTVVRGIREQAARGPVDGTIISEALYILVITLGVCCSLFAILVFTAGNWLYEGLYWQYLFIAQLWICSACINWFLGEVFRGLNHFEWSAFLEGQFGGLAASGVFLLTILGLSLVREIDLPTVLWTQMLSNLCVTAVPVLKISRAVNIQIKFFCPEFRRSARSRALESLPVAVSNLTVLGVWHAEIVLAGFWLTRPDLAIFTVIRQIMRLISQPLRLTNQSILPFVTDLYCAKDFAGLARLLQRSALIATIVALPLLLPLVLIPEWTLITFCSEKYAGGGDELRILAIGMFSSVIVGGTGLAMVMTGNQKAQMISSIVLTILYFLVVPPSIFYFGLQGAVISSSIFIALRSLVSSILVRKYVGVWAFAKWHVGDGVFLANKLKNLVTRIGRRNSRSGLR